MATYRYSYTVRRWVREEYSVTVDSEAPPTREQVADLAEDPHTVIVLRESVRRLGKRVRLTEGK